jgi:dihydropteroate synthase
MGIVNTTPDSFSDGGRWVEPGAAVEHGIALFAEGAAVVDVGGESTRPGAAPVAAAEELRRVLPVVEALAPHGRVSIDTMKPEVAEAAVRAGATLVNDVSGSQELAAVAAEHGVGWVCMHMQGTPRTMQKRPHYDDVVGEVRAWLVQRADAARRAGVEEIWIDPGIGFGKTKQHNRTLLAHLDVLVDTGYPVLVGTSRKSFLGGSVEERLEASVASAVWSVLHGAAMVRVHDVAPTVAALAVVSAQEAA